jgi:hypothetical protein
MRFLLVILLLLTNIIYSQDTTKYHGGISITMSKKIDSLINRKSNQPQKIYKIQLYFEVNKKDIILKKKEQFDTYHPDMESIIYFDRPYWKLKVGSFIDRDEAEDFMMSIIKWYPYSFITEEYEHIRKKGVE